MIPIITIQGPTASGKSMLAMELAKSFNSEIISADSRQIYKYMNIGTAKPPEKDQRLIKHHLLDLLTPDENYNAGRFTADASQIIESLHSKNKIPIIVGGTGFYIKALLNGLFKIPEIPESIRKKYTQILANEGNVSLHEKLKNIDPESAERIHPNDSQRLTRAMEVWDLTGRTLTSLWKEQQMLKKFSSFNILIEPDRESLYERINLRVDRMIEKGLVEEYKNLLEMGYTSESPGMKSVGYAEFFDYEPDSNLDECIEKIKQNTRNYAKRQYTWYRKQTFNLTLQSNEINIYIIKAMIEQYFSEN